MDKHIELLFKENAGKMRISSPFGYRTDPITGAAGVFHDGNDYAPTPADTHYPAYAIAPGTVYSCGTDSAGGKFAWVKFPTLGMAGVYYHLDSIAVTKGQKVKAGDKIGNIGTTGRSTGVHLHFGWCPLASFSTVWKNNEWQDFEKQNLEGKTMEKIMGIDVSRRQGNIDWEKVKTSGVRFAIIRAGCGSSASQKDTSFERNYAECKRLGIPVGAYWYSYATNTTAATMEAQAFLEVIKGKSFEYPIWFDQEYEPGIKALNNAQRTAIVKAALTALENAGYYAGLYASANWINCWLNYTELARFDAWAAQYGSACSAKLPFGMWQYIGGGGTCEGISGACDRDYAYKDYPAIIKGAGLNGFAKADTAHPAGDGNDDGTAAKDPESEQPTEAPAVKLYTLKIGPMSVGDKNTLEASAKALGIPVVEVE